MSRRLKITAIARKATVLANNLAVDIDNRRAAHPAIRVGLARI